MNIKDVIKNPDDYLILYNTDEKEEGDVIGDVIAEEIKHIEGLNDDYVFISGKSVRAMPWRMKCSDCQIHGFGRIIAYIIKKPWR